MSFSRVQGTGNNTGFNTSANVSIGFQNPVSAGNLLVAVGHWGSGSGTAGETFAFTDSQGNAWTVATQVNKSNYHAYSLSAWAIAKSSGANTVYFTPSIAGEMCLGIEEYSAGSASASGFLTAQAAYYASAPATWSTPGLTFSSNSNGLIVISYVVDETYGLTITPESGFTTGLNSTTTVGFSYLSQYETMTTGYSGQAVSATVSTNEGAIHALAFQVLPITIPPALFVRDKSQSRRRLWAD